jgi:hypothetical protein
MWSGFRRLSPGQEARGYKEPADVARLETLELRSDDHHVSKKVEANIMYLLTGLGQINKPYALGEGFELGDVKFGKRFTSRDYMWSDPIKRTTFIAKRPFVGGLRAERKLKIRFSEDWPTFQARFKKAIGRLSSPQMVASHLESLAGIEGLHARMVADKGNAKNFVVLDARVVYLKQPSGKWILNNFDFGLHNIAPPTWQWE